MNEQIIGFSGANIPVIEAAKIMKKDQQFVRQGMIKGILPIGVAYVKEGSSQYDFYISRSCFMNIRGIIMKNKVSEEV